MSEQWVVKHERYDAPVYMRLYGPFENGDAAAEWLASVGELPDFTVILPVYGPGELPEQLETLRRNGQIE
jgi:hypothetical protein